MKVKEVIVVEGRHDSDTLKSYIDCETIETQGTHLGKRTLELIARIQKLRGIIIFTDPDVPGDNIRHAINTAVPGCKNAFIAKDKAKTSKKVGIEHANKEDILEALHHVLTYDAFPEITITAEEFLALGLNGQRDSAKKRLYLGNLLFLGKANAKTLWKRLNMLGLRAEDISILLEQIDE